MKEEQFRIKILKEAKGIEPGKGLLYHKDPLEVQVAHDLISEGLVIGHADAYGMVTLTGIRDAGIQAIHNEKPHRKALASIKRIVFVLYSLALLSIGYILNLESVKAYLSDLIGKILK